MTRLSISAIAASALVLAGFVHAQANCPTKLNPAPNVRPSIASGYEYSVFATGVSTARGLEWDSQGRLLVVQQNRGIAKYTPNDQGGVCVTGTSNGMLVSDSQLNHGIAMSPDGATLYASTSENVYAWDYNAAAGTVANRRTIVKGMGRTGHVSRTLLIPRKVSNMLVVSLGSTQNVDPLAEQMNSGISQVKAFNLGSIPSGGYTYASSGTMLGWGLRNEVGLAEHPTTGGIWGVENSVDQLTRDGRDVHADNPGEELNFLGYLNGTTTKEQGSNFGYPSCLAAWKPADLPSNTNIKVGTQFTTSAANDARCASVTPPRLTFQAHTAPLDIKFNESGRESWISLHGSWNRNSPVGNAVVRVAWSDSTGQPTAAADSSTAAVTVFSNTNTASCPGQCFRPVGLIFDKQGRMYVSSDQSNEIYVIRRTGAAPGGLSARETNAGVSTKAGMEMLLGLGLAAVTWFMM